MWTTYTDDKFRDLTNKNVGYKNTGNKKYRLYLYETRIVQSIEFKIEALAEGGAKLATDTVTLNVTCPSYATVAEPHESHYANTVHAGTTHQYTPLYDREVTVYIGAKFFHNEYNFPGFYPTFEQCNFITGYHLTTASKDSSSDMFGRNNTMSSYGLIKPIPGMQLYMPFNFVLYWSERSCRPLGLGPIQSGKPTDVDCHRYALE